MGGPETSITKRCWSSDLDCKQNRSLGRKLLDRSFAWFTDTPTALNGLSSGAGAGHCFGACGQNLPDSGCHEPRIGVLQPALSELKLLERPFPEAEVC